MSRQRARPAAPPVESWLAEETCQMGQVLEEHGPMARRPRLRPGQPWNTPNPSRHSAARSQQTGQIQSLAAPMPATVHPAITAFVLGPGKLVLYDVRGSTQPMANFGPALRSF